MKTYKIEVDVTATAYIEVEAETEEEAMDQANNEVAYKTVEELKQWECSASIKSVTECCENCCSEESPEDIHDYEGIRLCNNCIEWAKGNDKDFRYIFAKQLKK